MTIDDIKHILKKRWLIAISFFSTALIATALYVFVAPPVYMATSSILIEKTPPRITNIQDVYQPDYSETQYYETQAKILQSYTLTEMVFKHLRLGEKNIFNSTMDPIEQIRKKISIEIVKNSHIVLIHVENNDPQLASNIANALANAYIEEDTKARTMAAQEAALRAGRIFREDVEISRIRIVDLARPPREPIRPRRLIDFIIGLLAGIFLGVLAALGLEFVESTKFTAADARALGFHFLSYIPSVNIWSNSTCDKELVCHKYTESAVSESFRVAAAAIRFLAHEKRSLKSLLVTSTVPREGKSFVSSNLAITFARMNERVLLIDMDLHRGGLHTIFNLPQKPGISEFLTDKATIDNIIRSTSIPGISLISTGDFCVNPAELLYSKKTVSLISLLKTRFDIILLDSAPMLSVADTSLLSSAVDGIVLVVNGPHTSIGMIRETKDRIIESHGTITGIIVNRVMDGVGEYGYYEKR